MSNVLCLQRRVTYLADNDLKDSNLYVVTVLTGMWQKAGTKAKVSLRLMGENGQGVKHVLADEHIALFQIGAEDLFVVAERKKLGRITHVSLWIDFSNSSSEW